MGQRPAGMSVGSVAFNLLTDIPGPRCPEESLKTHSSICVFLGYFGAVFVFDPQGCDSPLSVKVRRRWCLCRGVSLNTEILSIYSCVCVCVWNKRMFERESAERVVLENECEEGARLVFRSTFSWKEDPCCFPLWPWLTVWIHYAFSGALVQKSALKPPTHHPVPPCQPINWAYIYYFDLSFAGEWHQSGSSTHSSVKRRRCHPHSVRGRPLACAGFVVSEEERQSLGQHNYNENQLGRSVRRNWMNQAR